VDHNLIHQNQNNFFLSLKPQDLMKIIKPYAIIFMKYLLKKVKEKLDSATEQNTILQKVVFQTLLPTIIKYQHK
jgi:hypothetical protein